MKRRPLHLLLFAVAAATLLATTEFGRGLASDGVDALDAVLILTFAVLFGWLTFWCFLAAVGFCKLCDTRRRRARATPAPATSELPACAVLIPVHNEHAEHVFARVRAMMESLEQTGHAHAFELFVLSDTTDPDIWLREELSWAEIRRNHPGAPQLFYRRRGLKFRKKSGNISDFCQRWGNRYRYMLVLDADSVMVGATMVELVRRMELAPRLGILQTATLPAMRHSLYARREQFAASLYGPPLFAGLSVCFQGLSNFWGHNAIVRMRPFVAHCGLPALPGKPPLGGPILSHDFVEAALMIRAGYEVRLAWDLAAGSYEQPPTSLANAATRDRRWCQGNLQHLRLLFSRGFAFHSRVHFVAGVLFYVSSVFWAVFLLAFGIEDARRHFVDRTLHLATPVDRAALGVLGVVLVLLFVGKAFGLSLAFSNTHEAAGYGGRARLLLSVCLEATLGILVAPILMLHHIWALLSIVLGTSSDWHGATREESSTPLRDAWRNHRVVSIAGALLFAVSLWAVPDLAFRLTPIWVGMLLAVPLDTVLSNSSIGMKLRAHGILLAPVETRPPPILSRIEQWFPHLAVTGSTFSERFRRLIQDPWLNALHVALLQATDARPRPRSVIERIAARASVSGSPLTSPKERLALLSDAWAIRALHEAYLRRT